jgi:alkanesulfonate monooxygenase SsuD/methylene tetrahydromethanopterin reductase-like flavin-dependent oxidoreductase (luciferase family)
MQYGVVLPIWQLTIADAEASHHARRGAGPRRRLRAGSHPAKPATTQHYRRALADPFSLLAYLAGRTQRVRLGASVIVLPYRSALVAGQGGRDGGPGVARTFSSSGSAWVGTRPEFVDLRLPFRERGRLGDDYIRAIKAAWAADVPEYRGATPSFSGATFSPRPAQRPHPPIWVGGAPGAVSVSGGATLRPSWATRGIRWD